MLDTAIQALDNDKLAAIKAYVMDNREAAITHVLNGGDGAITHEQAEFAVDALLKVSTSEILQAATSLQPKANGRLNLAGEADSLKAGGKLGSWLATVATGAVVAAAFVGTAVAIVPVGVIAGTAAGIVAVATS